MLSMLSICSGGVLGWALGSNDAANVFGTAVTTNVIKYRVAIVLTAIFVIIGALVDGYAGVENLSDYAYQSAVNTPLAAFLVMLAAGVTVSAMTFLTFPVSTSQCVIGAIVGWGIAFDIIDFSHTTQFVSAWVITPIGACVICFFLCFITEKFLFKKISNLRAYSIVIKVGFYAAGIFSAYSLGANNVANVTAVYAGELGLLSGTGAALIGGCTIALGALTFSKRVMFTVGKRITDLSPLSGFLVTFSCAITVYVYAVIGIPVSSSQAVVGAVIGAGLINGVKNVDFKILRNIFVAWFGTPVIAGTLSYLMGTFIGA